MSNINRVNGYYWVKINVGWRIFHWSGDCWYHIGGLATFQDDDLQEINEQRLLSPDEQWPLIWHEVAQPVNLSRATKIQRARTLSALKSAKRKNK